MSTYLGTSINDSATIVLQAGEKIENVQGIALVIEEGALVKPGKGANVVGIALMTNDGTVEKDDDVTVQIKDMGKWAAGGEIAVGDELTTDAEGKAIPAESGDFITAVALSKAAEAGTIVNVQIIKAGYKSAVTVSEEGGN